MINFKELANTSNIFFKNKLVLKIPRYDLDVQKTLTSEYIFDGDIIQVEKADNLIKIH